MLIQHMPSVDLPLLTYPTLSEASWQARQMTSYSKRMPVTIRPFDKYPGGTGSCT